jgi:hypothetical protein
MHPANRYPHMLFLLFVGQTARGQRADSAAPPRDGSSTRAIANQG